MSAHPFTIIYIAGYGRSGSTLLDALLSQTPAHFGAGELRTLFREAANAGVCSCGDSVAKCEVWGEVLRIVLGRSASTHDAFTATSLAALTLRCESADPRPSDKRTYATVWRHTIGAIVDVTGCSAIIDSSKTPRTAIFRPSLLANECRFPTGLIHLTRDPRAVIWSVGKGSARVARTERPRFSRSRGCRAIAGWYGANLAVEFAALRRPRLPTLTLRYEDLTTDPHKALDTISSFIGINLQPVSARLNKGDPIPPGHGLAGNWQRTVGYEHIIPDRRWEERLPSLDRLIALASWPLAHRYGYSLRSADDPISSSDVPVRSRYET